MASIRIRNKTDSGGIPGLTKGELAVNLADGVLWVGSTNDTPIYLSGVQTFNGLTGAVTGVTVGGANVFTQLNTFEAGISASGATLWTLVVNGGISAGSSKTTVGQLIVTGNDVPEGEFAIVCTDSAAIDNLSAANPTLSGSILVVDGSQLTIESTVQTDVLGSIFIQNGISAAGGITFNSLSHFTQGLSGSGATLGTLVVNSGISASGGVTFHNAVSVSGLLTASGGISASGGITFNSLSHFTQGLSGSGATLGTLIVHNGISASGGITFINDVNILGSLKLQQQQVLSIYGQTADLPTFVQGAKDGDLAYVTGEDATPVGSGSGYYYFRENITWSPPGGGTTTGSRWVSVVNAVYYSDTNGDGVIDGLDLAAVLGAWGAIADPQYATGTVFGVRDGITSSFEVKVYGITTGKKASAFRITSDEAEPYIEMQASETFLNSRVIVSDSSGEPAFRVQTGRSVFSEGVSFEARTQFDGLITANAGISAGCGVTFGCLVNFTSGLSASGATLGTLVVNGGATFNGSVYMGATLTMNSNIRFNSGFGITGGFIDAGWY